MYTYTCEGRLFTSKRNRVVLGLVGARWRLHDTIFTLSDAFRSLGAKMAPKIAKRKPEKRQGEP